MPGPIMTAAQALKVYSFKSMSRHGDTVTLRNSEGKKVTVSAGTNVYHRGHGRFGIYSPARDARRYKEGAPRGKAGRVGFGKYRHTQT